MQIAYAYWHIGTEVGAWPKAASTIESAALPTGIQRRLTSLGRLAIQNLSLAQKASGQQNLSWVISSRHGDTQRMERLLTDLSNNEQVSPTDFGMSVHNAIIGMFSIATKNKAAHTAISAGDKSFQAGLIETYALHKAGQDHIGYMYYDAPLPKAYEEKVEEKPFTCIAIIFKKDTAAEKSAKNIMNTFSDIRKYSDVVLINNFIGFLKSNERNNTRIDECFQQVHTK